MLRLVQKDITKSKNNYKEHNNQSPRAFWKLEVVTLSGTIAPLLCWQLAVVAHNFAPQQQLPPKTKIDHLPAKAKLNLWEQSLYLEAPCL